MRLSRVGPSLAGSYVTLRPSYENISRNGLFIRTPHPKPVGTRVEFEFTLPEGRQPVIGKGIVRWVQTETSSPKGMGIQFLELNDEGRHEISEVLRQRKESDSA